MVGEFAIRPAAVDDVGEVARLFRAVREACLPYLPELHTPEADLWFFRERVSPTCTVWVGGALGIQGFCAWRTGRVDHLYVAPEMHGRGLGSALLGRAMAVEPVLRLWAFQRNAPALRFYTRRGFRVVEETDGGGNEEREPDRLLEWRRTAA